MNKTWFQAAGVRALKTFAQTLVATIPAAVVIDVKSDWVGTGLFVASIVGSAALAAILSLLTSIAGLPELKCEEPSE